jgi:transcriptional regulator with XRE-family HTH domain
MSKKAEKTQAIELRKRGFTLREISKYTNVSVSTISLWLKDEAWSARITIDNQKRAARDNSKRISLLNKARSNQFKKLYAEAERSAVTEFKHYKHNPLFTAGLMLYTALGDATADHQMRITSTRMDVHRIFISFATEYLGVPRETVRFWLSLYPDLDPEKCSRTWSKALRIPLSQFHKYQVIEGRSKKRTLHSGAGNTIIGGTVLKKRLLKWIQIAMKEL